HHSGAQRQTPTYIPGPTRRCGGNASRGMAVRAAGQAAAYGSGTPRGWQSNGDPAFLQRQGGCTEFVSGSLARTGWTTRKPGSRRRDAGYPDELTRGSTPLADRAFGYVVALSLR